MSDPNEALLEKIAKLLRHADGNANENEATNALTLAQKLADAYNIDIEGLRQRGVDTHDKKRDDKKFSGGLYPYQRTLYNEIAKLNHCLYWTYRGTARGSKYEHRLVGSKLNVLLTRQMAEYLQGAVERLAREWAGDPRFYFTKKAHLYREGMVDTIVGRLYQKRREEEAERKRQNEARAKAGGNQLVTIDDVAEREREANYDFKWGEGAYRRAKEREEMNRRHREEAAAAMAKWEAEHPEEAARVKAEAAAKRAAEEAEYERKEEQRRKRQERYRAKHGDKPRRERRTKYDEDAYWDGREDGQSISLDDQIDEEKREAIAC